MRVRAQRAIRGRSAMPMPTPVARASVAPVAKARAIAPRATVARSRAAGNHDALPDGPETSLCALPAFTQIQRASQTTAASAITALKAAQRRLLRASAAVSPRTMASVTKPTGIGVGASARHPKG